MLLIFIYKLSTNGSLSNTIKLNDKQSTCQNSIINLPQCNISSSGWAWDKNFSSSSSSGIVTSSNYMTVFFT